MDLEEAIKTAIEYETRVRNVYLDAEEKATNPVGKRVFKVLVSEEQRHLEYLESRLDEWSKTGAITIESLDTVLPSADEIESEINKLKNRIDIDQSDKRYTDVELQMLKKALEVEDETSNFYIRMVDELPDDGKKLFKRFVEIEVGHKAIVQAEIDAVTGMGFWFDMPEFNLASK